MNASTFTIDGKMVYQIETQLVNNQYPSYIRRAVQQADGSFWFYSFYKGHKSSVGTPQRGVKHQAKILQFVADVKTELAT